MPGALYQALKLDSKRNSYDVLRGKRLASNTMCAGSPYSGTAPRFGHCHCGREEDEKSRVEHRCEREDILVTQLMKGGKFVGRVYLSPSDQVDSRGSIIDELPNTIQF